ncbi:hypothetical protein SO802_001825 [Lithocarpus litseifolius]|uniref:RNase H type-1 domain-containing protein n=1 Tax=Lithocarpus litseifolius TaxID=425828 RepID=A0AAW2DWG3_9ROSI
MLLALRGFLEDSRSGGVFINSCFALAKVSHKTHGLELTPLEFTTRWERPTSGWVKLNTDGSSLGNPGLAGSGGVIRDEEGNWLMGFARNIGITTSFQVELWGLRDGLNLCVERNFSAVEVELDARAVLNVITSLVCSNSLITSLVDDCKQLASRIPRIRFNHCYREANRSADKLARMGAVQQRPFTIFLSPPVDVFNIFISELFGETIARACPESVVSV